MMMHRREESEMKGRGKMRAKREPKKMSSGGSAHGDVGFNGERTTNSKSYSDREFDPVNHMVEGRSPTTNMATVKACQGGHMGAKKMAAGGVGKVRKGQY